MAVSKYPRLNAVTVPITIGAVEANPAKGIEASAGHQLAVSLAYEGVDPEAGRLTGLREVVFVTRGKIGHGMDDMLRELSIKLSRAIQGRDPETG